MRMRALLSFSNTVVNFINTLRYFTAIQQKYHTNQIFKGKNQDEPYVLCAFVMDYSLHARGELAYCN